MAGNLSLQHELKMIDLANTLLQERALTDEFRTRIGFDSDEPIRVRSISMSDALIQRLDYPSKLSRNRAHLARLVADGEAQASAFLEELDSVQRVVPVPAPGEHPSHH